MGIFSSLFGKKKEQLPIVRLDSSGEYNVEVVGESHYQEALSFITGGKTPNGHELEIDALLIHDDGNPYDNQAIAVSISGEIVGHLDKRLARQFRARMKEAGVSGHPAACGALVVGGWDRGNGDGGSFGVRLDLPTA